MEYGISTLVGVLNCYIYMHGGRQVVGNGYSQVLTKCNCG